MDSLRLYMKCDSIKFSLGVVLSCVIQVGCVMKMVQYTVWYTVTFGACVYPSRVRDTVTTSAVTSEGCELALGSSQISNI